MVNKIKVADRKIPPRTLTGLTIFFLKEILRKKKWILLPLWILLLSVALILVISGNSFILPAIYIVGF